MLSCASKLDASGTGRLKKIVILCAATMLIAGCGHQREANGNPPKQGPAQQVRLNWKQATNEWMVQLNNGPEVKPAAAHSPLAKATGPTMFVVDIVGNSTASFKDPDGLSVWTGSKSAPQSGVNSTQILGPIITKDGKELVFYDLNEGDPVTLNYSLHFNNGIPTADPIIDNGGS